MTTTNHDSDPPALRLDSPLLKPTRTHVRFRLRAILIHPITQAHLGWDEICGLPVLGDEAVPEGRFRVRCEGSSHGVEEQATLWLLESLDPELQPADATAPTGHRAS